MESPQHVGMGLTGRTLGIVGAGGIGRELARRILPFDMNILAYDPYADGGTLRSEGIRLVSLEHLLRDSDFVVLTCLLSPETRHLISGDELRLMKSTAYVVNVARGPVVDEAALIEALRSNQIAGAGLDVFEQEPVSPDNPLLRMPNTIVTPHGLSLTDESFNEIAHTALSSIADHFSGRTPRHVVNKVLLDANPMK